MQMHRMNITLPAELASSLRKLIPARSRSKFIADAVKDKLKKQNLKKQLEKSAEAQKAIVKEISEDFKYADAQVLAKLP